MTIVTHTFKFWEDPKGNEFQNYKASVVLENITHISETAGCFFMHLADGSGAQLNKEEKDWIMNLLITVAKATTRGMR